MITEVVWVARIEAWLMVAIRSPASQITANILADGQSFGSSTSPRSAWSGRGIFKPLTLNYLLRRQNGWAGMARHVQRKDDCRERTDSV
jgi:hypothetical protein